METTILCTNSLDAVLYFWPMHGGRFSPLFFGCGSVIVPVLYSAFSSLFQVGAVWGYRDDFCDLCDEALVLRASEYRCKCRNGSGGKNADRQIGPIFFMAISGRICSSSRSVFVILIEHNSELREQ
jgi:hypothetical protein